MTQPPKIAVVSHATRYAGPPAVRALLAGGWSVHAHDPAFADAGRAAAFAAAHAGVHTLRAASPEDAVREAVADGMLDVLVSNQLTVLPPATITDVDEAALRATLEALTVEPWRWIRSAVEPMRRGGGGRIVLVTSAAGRRPGGRVVAYSAARAAANAMIAGLAKELGPDAIAITGIAPNWFASPDTYPPEQFATNERFRARVQRNVPLGRLSAPGEMEALIAYLASPEAAFVTGEVIGFSGGWL